MSYKGLEVSHNDALPHLGGNVDVGDPFTFCPSVWNYIIDRFCPTSMMDLGCGAGNCCEYFFKKGIKVVAVDGLPENIARSLYPAIEQDLTKGAVNTRVDFVHCMEVVEHIEERYLSNLVNSLKCGKIIFITHALPGQVGFHHVNLQTSEYWIEKMAEQNCALLQEDTTRLRGHAARDGAAYAQSTGMLFVNRDRN